MIRVIIRIGVANLSPATTIGVDVHFALATLADVLSMLVWIPAAMADIFVASA
jgi:hypothetical protein